MAFGERIQDAMEETAFPVPSSMSINLIELLRLCVYFLFFGGGGGVSQILKEQGPPSLRRHFLAPTVHEFLLCLSLGCSLTAWRPPSLFLTNPVQWDSRAITFIPSLGLPISQCWNISCAC